MEALSLEVKDEERFASSTKRATNGCGSKLMGSNFGVDAPPILEPILVGIGMFTGGTIWIWTHGQPSNGRSFAFSGPPHACCACLTRPGPMGFLWPSGGQGPPRFPRPLPFDDPPLPKKEGEAKTKHHPACGPLRLRSPNILDRGKTRGPTHPHTPALAATKQRTIFA